MSKKHMGSSIDDFMKEEGIFEESQAQAIKEVVAWQLAEAMKNAENLEEQDGNAAEDEPHPGGPAARSEERHHAREPAEGGGDGRSSRHD